MSTFTDGAPPSVDPEPADPEHCMRDDGDDPAGDTGSLWLREEIQRRIAANHSDSGGRHARRSSTAAASGAADGGAREADGGAREGAPRYPRHSTATPGPAAPAPVSAAGTVRPAMPAGRPRRDQILAESATAAPPAWSGPPAARQAPVGPSSGGAPQPGPPQPAPLRPGTQPGAPRPDTGVGAPSLPRLPGPAGGPAVPVPPLPAPPSGPAAARLLAPPPQAGPPPVGVRPAPPQFPSRPPGPVRRGPSEPFFTDEVLWSASAVPSTAGGPPAFSPAVVAVPEQRTSDEPGADPLPMARVPGAGETDTSPDKRVRVVLAERKGVARPVRTVIDVQEGTAVGELLRSNLIGSQLTVALRFALGAGLTLGVLPVLFAIFPDIGRIEMVGLRLPWLILGVLVYPFLLGLGWWHTRTAERVEQNFADHVQD